MTITDAVFAGSSTRTSQKPKQKLPEFAFIGRSNVGKSSLINMITGRKKLAMTSATPGKTKVVNHFLINGSWYLVDLPGYGYAKLPQKAREELKAVIRDYIHNSEELMMLFVLVDSRHDIGRIDLDIIYTKCDKQGPNVLAAQIARNEDVLLQDWEELPPTFRSSSQTAMGRDEILDYIDNVLANPNN